MADMKEYFNLNFMHDASIQQSIFHLPSSVWTRRPAVLDPIARLHET